MSDVSKGLSRRNVLVSASGLSVAGLLAATSGYATPAAAASVTEEAFEATADKVVDALEGVYGLHPGKRRNHTERHERMRNNLPSPCGAQHIPKNRRTRENDQ